MNLKPNLEIELEILASNAKIQINYLFLIHTMNIGDKDILGLIAAEINDKFTWYSFALICKKTALICKNMTKRKKLEFKHIEFELDDSEADYSVTNRISCWWFGQYTRGQVTCRGTRIWFKSNGLNVIFEDGMSNIAIQKFKIDIENDQCRFPGNACQIRKEYLSEIISSLKNGDIGGICLICKPSDLTLNYFFPTSLQLQLKDKLYVFGLDPTTVWDIIDLDSVIDELERVLKLCEDNDVTFDWI